MGEQEDPLVSVHDIFGFLADFDSLSDPPCCPISQSDPSVPSFSNPNRSSYVSFQFQPMSLFKKRILVDESVCFVGAL